MARARLLIVCTGNSARSQIAEGFFGTKRASGLRWSPQVPSPLISGRKLSR